MALRNSVFPTRLIPLVKVSVRDMPELMKLVFLSVSLLITRPLKKTLLLLEKSTPLCKSESP